MTPDLRTAVLAYADHQLETIEFEGLTWLRSEPLVPPLGLGSARALRQIFERNADEFGPRETRELRLPTPGGMQMVRVFSLHGARLLAMLASTPEAKRFRRWVLQQLEAMDHAAPNPADEAAREAEIQAVLARVERALRGQDRRYVPFAQQLAVIDAQIADLNRSKANVYEAARGEGLDPRRLKSDRGMLINAVVGPLLRVERLEGRRHG